MVISVFAGKSQAKLGLNEGTNYMKTGLYSGLSNEDYHGGPGISKSGLDLIERSPLHYWASYLDPARKPREEKAHFTFGTAVHTAVLEPETFDDRYVIVPEGIDRRTKDGKEIWADLQLQALEKGADLLPYADFAKAMAMKASCHTHPMSKQIFREGIAEQSVFWTDEETGVLCKCRPDWLMGGDNPAILDLKTTQDASPNGFIRSAYTYRYHVAAAWYLDGLEAATGSKPDVFMFLAVEKEAPYASAYYYADDAMLAVGRAEYRRLLRIYADCINDDIWPGYNTKLQPLSLPKWADVSMLGEAA